MRLKKYRRKRNFQQSPEPKGKIIRRKHSKKLFIIQKHAASHLHYDFRIELDGVLLSWAVPKGPCFDPQVKRLAMHVEDHPLAYGSFEGIIPKGQYGGGTVMLWDKGEWISDDDNPKLAYAKGDLKFTLKAKKLKGRWKLIRMHHDDKTWLLIKVKDKFAQSMQDFDITLAKPNSVLSHRTLDQIAAHANKVWGKKIPQAKPSKKNSIASQLSLPSAAYPKTIAPQLATLVDAPPAGKNWLHEIKLDGYRIIAFKKNNKTKLMTRNGNNWTNKFKSIADAIDEIPLKNGIFDGEIVILDAAQHANFQLLQNAIKLDQGRPFIFYIFDLLYYEKQNLMELPLIKRKEILSEVFKKINIPILRYSDHVLGSGNKILAQARKLNLEGIVSKDSNSPYVQSRTKNWLKIKCNKRQEFVIGGFTKPKNQRQFFGSLLLGTFNKNNELIYHGHVGTGFTDASLEDLHKKLIKIRTNKNPFIKKPPASSGVMWVKPQLVAEVEFTEWTEDDILRHPSFKGLRKDKAPAQVTREKERKMTNMSTPVTQKNKKITLTHPDKILFKEDKISKSQLLEYYDTVSDWILPYIKDRPITLVRCPNGYEHCFYQKHLENKHSNDLHEISIQEKNAHENYFYINNKKGLLALPQLGALEIHPWGSKIQKIEYPDMIIIDLDPDAGVSWKKVVSAAFVIKKELASIKLRSFVKTTGGKGLHIVVPIKSEYAWEDVKNFSKVFANYIMQIDPKSFVTNMAKKVRVGKLFIDYLRNQKSATAVAPYSTRARIHAPVSTPIDWDELSNDRRDIYFTLQTIPERLSKLKKDPWREYFKIKQSLNLEKLHE